MGERDVGSNLNAHGYLKIQEVVRLFVGSEDRVWKCSETENLESDDPHALPFASDTTLCLRKGLGMARAM